MTRFVDLVTKVTLKNSMKRGSRINLVIGNVDRLSADLKLTTDMKPVFGLLRFDPEHETNQLKRLFTISDNGLPSASTTEVDPDDGVRIQKSPLKLDLQNEDGNTVLHCITSAMKKDSQDKDTYLKLFDAVISSAFAWWCQFKQLQFPTDDETKLLYKRKAVRYLTTEIENSEDLSVLELAFQIGATKVAEKLLMMEGVTCTPIDAAGLQKFDVTYITPITGGLQRKRVCHDKPSCLERLMSSPENIASGILDLPPLMEIERSYSRRLTVTYFILTLFHIAYMISISVFSTNYLMEIKNATKPFYFKDNYFYFRLVGLMEPCYFIMALFIAIFFGKGAFLVNCTNEHKLDICLKVLEKNLLTVFFIPYICLVLALVYYTTEDNVCTANIFIDDITPERNFSHLNILSAVTLLYGWLLTFIFAYGIESIHFFLQVFIHVIWQNVRKIMIVYILILLAFTMAIHSLFLASSYVSNTYKTPFHTMFMLFNLMMGIGELFDEEGKLESSLEERGVWPLLTKFLYIAYIIFVTVILLNLLIAMLSKSYSRMRNEHLLSWRVKSIELGIQIERIGPYIIGLIPFLPLFFKKIRKVQKGPIFENAENSDDNNCWHVVVKNDKNESDKNITQEEIEETIMEKMQVVETKLDHMEESTEAKLDFLIEILSKVITACNDNDSTDVCTPTERTAEDNTPTTGNSEASPHVTMSMDRSLYVRL